MREVLSLFLMSMMRDVDTFQKNVLGLECAPGPLPPHRLQFKLGHMHEELEEFKKAWDTGAFEDQVDALIDLIYVALGAILEMGVSPHEAFGAVHDANMQKLRGVTKRGEAFDALKPEGWQPPDHAALIARLALGAIVSPVFLRLTAMRESKGANYNRGSVQRKDHFPYGNDSHFQMLNVKFMRVKSLYESQRLEVQRHAGESDIKDIAKYDKTQKLIERELNDLINYACFWAEDLNGELK